MENIGLDLDAWERWISYRKAIKKPIKEVSVAAAKRRLAAFGSDQAAVVEQSIAFGWQGLFALKEKPGGASRRNGTTRSRYEESGDKLRAWAEGFE